MVTLLLGKQEKVTSCRAAPDNQNIAREARTKPNKDTCTLIDRPGSPWNSKTQDVTPRFQQAAVAFQQVDREEISPTGNAVAAVVWHRGSVAPCFMRRKALRFSALPRCRNNWATIVICKLLAEAAHKFEDKGCCLRNISG